MKQTKVSTLIGWLFPSATAGYLFAKAVSANGGRVPVTPWNLILTLIAIVVILIAFAVPMIRYRRAVAELIKKPTAPRPKRLNPFYAVRLVVLAKATAISGSLFSGWHAGVIWMQLSSPVTPDSIWQNVAGLVASIAMAIAGVIIERICRIPEDGSDAAQTSGATSTKGRAAIAEKSAK